MKEKIKEGWDHLSTRINDMSIRERAMVFITLLVLIYFAWDSALMGPLERERTAKLERLSSIERDTRQFNQEAELLISKMSKNPDEELNQELERLRTQLIEVDAAIAERMDTLIEPAKMATVLRDMLQEQAGLTLIRIAKRPTIPLLPTDNSVTNEMSGIYKHRVTMEFNGSYKEIVAYLKTLQSLRWRFLWENISVKTNVYPQATVVFEVSSLSLSEGWLDV